MGGQCFGDKLSLELKQKAKMIAAAACEDHLAIFVGAGVSMGAGMPSWNKIIDMVQDDVKRILEKHNLPHNFDVCTEANWRPVEMASLMLKYIKLLPEVY